MAIKSAAVAGSKGNGLALLRLMRPRQWVKNAFVAAPLFFTPWAVSTGSVLRIVAGVLCFCAVSSAVPSQRLRPHGKAIAVFVDCSIWSRHTVS